MFLIDWYSIVKHYSTIQKCVNTFDFLQNNHVLNTMIHCFKRDCLISTIPPPYEQNQGPWSVFESKKVYKKEKTPRDCEKKAPQLLLLRGP